MPDPRKQAQARVAHDRFSLLLLWAWYRGNGGAAGLTEFEAFLHELIVVDDFELKILAWALEDSAAARP